MKRISATWLLAAAASLVLCAAWPAAQALGDSPPAACTTFRVRPQDQVWLVSTRHLGCGVGYQPTFQIWRYEQGVWQPSKEAQFFASDSADVVTPIYIHGNRIDSGLASSYGLSVYFELVGKLDAEPPARFVIWSWPSDQIKGPLNDVRAKAARSDYDAYYLASFLSRMQPDVRVGLLGYSFGARIVSGAMHLSGGGALLGQTVTHSPDRQFRVALWAAAEHHYWYQPGQYHDRALAAAEATYVTVNPCDSVLSRYRLMEKCGNPCAVGHSGIYGRNLLPPDVNETVEEINVSNIVGSEHHWRPYLYSQYIQDRTRQYVLFHPLSAAARPPATAHSSAGAESAAR